ncbi:hypothetical protein CSC94_05870 [Zhengella mangrovi]|uniref:Uncharacterized protein n=1 Tax=Zhengella mangrovi TaxID=1982044 RepID=A0A2G1QRL0_9HYPH|nr:DUF1833 family protein [Zhengella mangrovi]PHP68177.1 hypothetical protein CSC94_05870 [Zhengella mangrovi]
MTRSVPASTRLELEREASGEALLLFVDITHPELGNETIRLVSDGVDYELDGNLYTRGGFDLQLLTDSDQPPSAKFTFSNVDRSATNMLADVDGPAEVRMRAISTEYFNTREDPRVVLDGVTVVAAYDAQRLYLTDITMDDVACAGTLRGYDYRQESWPSKIATEALCPGLFVI